MKTFYFFVVFMFAFPAVFAQNKAPNEQTFVNKKYDKDGNLIAYDSSYVHTWSSDSSFLVPFGDPGFFAENFEDIEKMMNQMMNDSALLKRGFMPFGGSGGFHSFANPDSAFSGMMPFLNDSDFFNHDFMFPDMKELQKKFEKQFGQSEKPQFEQNLTDQQLKQLQEMKERHRKEMEELRKSWE